MAALDKYFNIREVKDRKPAKGFINMASEMLKFRLASAASPASNFASEFEFPQLKYLARATPENGLQIDSCYLNGGDNHNQMVSRSIGRLLKALQGGELDAVLFHTPHDVLIEPSFYTSDFEHDTVILINIGQGKAAMLTALAQDGNCIGLAYEVNKPTLTQISKDMFTGLVPDALNALVTDTTEKTTDCALDTFTNLIFDGRGGSSFLKVMGVKSVSEDKVIYVFPDATKELTADKNADTVVTQPTEKQEIKTMAIIKNNSLATLIAANKGAALDAAKLETGRAINDRIQAVVTKHVKVPALVKPMLKTPVGTVVIANLFNVLVREFASENKAALMVGEAAVNSAAYELLRGVDLPAMIAEVMGGINVTAPAIEAGKIEL